MPPKFTWGYFFINDIGKYRKIEKVILKGLRNSSLKGLLRFLTKTADQYSLD